MLSSFPDESSHIGISLKAKLKQGSSYRAKLASFLLVGQILFKDSRFRFLQYNEKLDY